MDQNTPREASREQDERTQRDAVRTALIVLGLCFTLAVLGRGLSESFTVFLKPISENFGWDRAQVVSIYSLTWLISGLTAPLVGRLFDHSGPRFSSPPMRKRSGSSGSVSASPSGSASR